MGECGIEEAFLRRSFSLADRGSSVQLTLRRLCDKLSSSYYCNCNCYCNRDSYMKCKNNDNNILLLLLFAVTVLFHLSFHFTICMLYQHGTLCTPLLFPSPLSCSVNACKFPILPTLCGEFAQQLQSSTVSVGSLSSRSACKLAQREREQVR